MWTKKKEFTFWIFWLHLIQTVSAWVVAYFIRVAKKTATSECDWNDFDRKDWTKYYIYKTAAKVQQLKWCLAENFVYEG